MIICTEKLKGNVIAVIVLLLNYWLY